MSRLARYVSDRINAGAWAYLLACALMRLGYPVTSGHRRYGVPHGETDHEGAAVGCLVILVCMVVTGTLLAGGLAWGLAELWEIWGW